MAEPTRRLRDELFSLATAIFQFDAGATLREIEKREAELRKLGWAKDIWRDTAARDALLLIERAKAEFVKRKQHAEQRSPAAVPEEGGTNG